MSEIDCPECPGIADVRMGTGADEDKQEISCPDCGYLDVN